MLRKFEIAGTKALRLHNNTTKHAHKQDMQYVILFVLVFCMLQAFVFGGCLSPVARPSVLPFKSAGGQGGLVKQMTKSLEGHIVSHHSFESLDYVDCFPLADILEALGVNHVDYLSLDVQGAELAILKTIDFHRLRIDVVGVEVYDDDLNVRQKMFNEMHQFFKDTSLYRLVSQMPMDMIFRHRDLDAAAVRRG
jgi:Methyltransferase FkbM domain